MNTDATTSTGRGAPITRPINVPRQLIIWLMTGAFNGYLESKQKVKLGQQLNLDDKCYKIITINAKKHKLKLALCPPPPSSSK